MKPDENLESDHTRTLTDCNGQASSSVKVWHSATCGGTSYETVTYQCIKPDSSTMYANPETTTDKLIGQPTETGIEHRTTSNHNPAETGRPIPPNT